jgi:hypothetical protein
VESRLLSICNRRSVQNREGSETLQYVERKKNGGSECLPNDPRGQSLSEQTPQEREPNLASPPKAGHKAHMPRNSMQNWTCSAPMGLAAASVPSSAQAGSRGARAHLHSQATRHLGPCTHAGQWDSSTAPSGGQGGHAANSGRRADADSPPASGTPRGMSG